MQDIQVKKRRIAYGAVLLLVMGLIFLFSAQDGEKSGSFSDSFLGSLIGRFLSRVLPRLTEKGADYDIRKYAHMFEYFCLGISSSLFFREFFRRPPLTALTAFAWSFLYACSDEWHQTFVPGRVGCFQDVLVDSLGITAGVLGMLLMNLLDKRRKRE